MGASNPLIPLEGTSLLLEVSPFLVWKPKVIELGVRYRDFAKLLRKCNNRTYGIEAINWGGDFGDSGGITAPKP